ncbi:MAG: hypothetical protein ABF706_05915 [Novacetimonas hansenii]
MIGPPRTLCNKPAVPVMALCHPLRGVALHVHHSEGQLRSRQFAPHIPVLLTQPRDLLMIRPQPPEQ